MTLFVSDLDGTLLNEASILETAALNELNALLAEGVHFTIATARAYPSIAEILDGLNLRLPVIEQNGAILREFHSGKVISAHNMALAPVDGINQIFARHGAHPMVSILEGDENTVWHGEIANEGMEWAMPEMLKVRNARRLVPYEYLHDVPAGQVLLYRYLGPEPEIRQIGQEISDEIAQASVTCFDNFYSGTWEINVSCHRANKGEGIKILRQHAPDGEKIVVFGDSDNDLDMFLQADEAYAVFNAHPDVKSRAQAVIGRNSDNAVPTFIRERLRAC